MNWDLSIQCSCPKDINTIILTSNNRNWTGPWTYWSRGRKKRNHICTPFFFFLSFFPCIIHLQLPNNRKRWRGRTCEVVTANFTILYFISVVIINRIYIFLHLFFWYWNTDKNLLNRETNNKRRKTIILDIYYYYYYL